MAKYQCVIGLVAGLASASVCALGLGHDPLTEPVINPKTGYETPVWRLAGYTPGMASSVQISPSWIMSSHHGAPVPGATFQNGFGSAVVSACHQYRVVQTIDDDFVICKLQAPIQVPAGFEFPVLVEDPGVLAGNLLTTGLAHTIAGDLGYFLSVAHGAPHSGLARYMWTDLVSMPLDERAAELTHGVPTPAAFHDSGDSGSPKFWFSPKNSKIGMVGIQVGKAPAGIFYSFLNVYKSGTTRLQRDRLQWVQQTIQSLGGEAVQISSAVDFHGAPKAAPNWLPADSLKATSTATSATLSWTATAEQLVNADRFTVYLKSNGDVVRFQFASKGARSQTFTGLTTGAAYEACVVPSGFGMAHSGRAKSKADNGAAPWVWLNSFNCLNLALNPTPVAATNVRLELVSKMLFGSGPYLVPQVTWVRPSSPVLPVNVSHRVELTKSGVDAPYTLVQEFGEGVVKYTGATPVIAGERVCVVVTPFTATYNMGPKSATQCVSLAATTP